MHTPRFTCSSSSSCALSNMKPNASSKGAGTQSTLTISSVESSLSQWMENKEAAEYNYQNEDELPQLKCPFCTCFFVDPTVHENCGHVYCASCLQKALEAGHKTCPVCREDFEKTQLQRWKRPAHRFALDQLDAIPVWCSNKLRGCAWGGPRANVTVHLNRCEKHPCPNSARGCQTVTTKALMGEHLNVCPLSIIPCDHADIGCEVKLVRAEMPAHLKACAVFAAFTERKQQEEKERLIVQRREQDRRRLEEKEREDARRRQQAKEQAERQAREQREELVERARTMRKCRAATVRVAGKVIETTLETLTSCADSVLAMLVEDDLRAGGPSLAPCVTLDANPKMVEYILDWLRRGVYPTSLSGDDLALLRAEARHLNISSLLAALDSPQRKRVSNFDILHARRPYQLSSCDLSGLLLSGADLRQANLRYSSLVGCDLRGADLTKALLDGADLTEAKLDGANLTGATVRDTVLPTSLRGVVLTNVNLSQRTLCMHELAGAVLNGANLTACDLSHLDLSGVSLLEANLSSAVVVGTTFPSQLQGVDFSGVDLSQRNFEKCVMKEVNMSKCNVKQASFTRTVLIGANLTHADFSEANVAHALLSEANMSGANFSQANLYGADLSKANLEDCNLSEANLSQSNISEANFCRTNLSKAKFAIVCLGGACWDTGMLLGMIQGEYEISWSPSQKDQMNRLLEKQMEFVGYEVDITTSGVAWSSDSKETFDKILWTSEQDIRSPHFEMAEAGDWIQFECDWPAAFSGWRVFGCRERNSRLYVEYSDEEGKNAKWTPVSNEKYSLSLHKWKYVEWKWPLTTTHRYWRIRCAVGGICRISGILLRGIYAPDD